MRTRLVLLAAPLCLVVLAGCGKKDKEKVAEPIATASPTLTATTQGAASAVAPQAPAPVAVPPGSPPPDGKYERVVVDGVTVPMIHVMNGGKVVLVDTDGAKPRSWEEQYKRKRELPAGQFDVHKTNTNKNDSFEDDAIDKEGLWVVDAKGNITKR
ncbi:MAG: hypothetical protein IPF92_26745 [Myxococcales bacterium]|jgi:hypothetical protein|nr:hypothetical protein [Myxococcales bacterium]MBL0194140.1 hypothetical protein [Myxococcales bacterium]HQY62470.1 hypothetical protein [Polyangiaceae bacterium]